MYLFPVLDIGDTGPTKSIPIIMVPRTINWNWMKFRSGGNYFVLWIHLLPKQLMK